MYKTITYLLIFCNVAIWTLFSCEYIDNNIDKEISELAILNAGNNKKSIGISEEVTEAEVKIDPNAFKSTPFTYDEYKPQYEPRQDIMIFTAGSYDVRTIVYSDKKGNGITRAEYDRQIAQSKQDEAAYFKRKEEAARRHQIEQVKAKIEHDANMVKAQGLMPLN